MTTPYEVAKTLKAKQFQRRYGIQRKTFNRMRTALRQHWGTQAKPGPFPKLSLEDKLLVTLEYWREYRTYFHIGTSWGVSEATICRTVHAVEDAIMASGLFRLPGKKHLLKGFGPPKVVVMDVTEVAIERPKKHQRWFYSGKRKQHTLKCQVIIDGSSGRILCTFFGTGRQHDFKVFKASGIYFHRDTQSLVDKGYQGLDKFHPKTRIPHKKPKGGTLSNQQKQDNRALARERIGVEHVNRHLKIFRILGSRYRNRRRRFGLRCNLIAALYNHKLSLSAG